MARPGKNNNHAEEIRCPYCNQDFDPADLLFCDFTDQLIEDEGAYDPVHAAFMKGIITFTQEQSEGRTVQMAKRKRYYFHPWSDKNRQGKPFTKPNSMRMGDAGFPESITIYRAKGLTPLMEAGQEEEKAVEQTAEVEEGFGGFRRGGIRQDSEGPQFSPDTTFVLSVKACPKCHCRLPEAIGKYPLHRIGVLGGTRAGKTTYMTLAAHQLENSVGLPKGLVETCLISEESKRFFDFLIGSLKINRLAATPMHYSDGVQVVFPIVATITPTGNAQPFILAINDCPGEAMLDRAYLNNFYALEEMEGALMVMDPSQFLLHETMRLESKEVCDVAFNRTIGEFTLLMNNMSKLRNMAFVLAKLDLVYGIEQHHKIRPGDYSCIDESDLREQHHNGVALNWIEQLSIQVSGAISTNLGYADYLDKLKSLEERKSGLVTKSFCCSTRTWNPVLKVFIDPTSPDSPEVNVNLTGYRLLEPLLYLLARNGNLPVKMEVEPEHDDDEISDPDIEGGSAIGRFFRRLFG